MATRKLDKLADEVTLLQTTEEGVTPVTLHKKKRKKRKSSGALSCTPCSGCDCKYCCSKPFDILRGAMRAFR
jgi:hypothetical protein